MAQPRIIDVGRWSAPGLAVLTYGFRPFFLCGAIYAALGIPVWLLMLIHGVEPLGPFDGLGWHIHEMIFGFLVAIMAGFALTAIPNWTGRLPLSGLPLAGLISLWVIGRLASSFVAAPLPALMLDCAFLFVLALAIWREILAGANHRNIPIAMLFTVMALANLAFHLETGWSLTGPGYAERAALGVAAVMITLIGGRIVPSFTRNWMARLSIEPLPVPFRTFDKAVLLVTAAAMAAWVGWPDGALAGSLLIIAGGLSLVRLMRWRGVTAWKEPIVLILHVGYLWLGLSLVFLGLAALGAGVVASTAVHALTAGAIGTMTLAVMTRASLGHTGRALVADGSTIAIYVLVTFGAVLRVAAPLADSWYLALITAGGLTWSAAFALFAIAYGPLLVMPGPGRT
ncbi:MAG: NnrS family protein [Hyphomicrobiales bacterium]|nr:NnrS family protein [Hyphomicrobiales bacterium]